MLRHRRLVLHAGEGSDVPEKWCPAKGHRQRQSIAGRKKELNNLATEWSKCAIVRANDDGSGERRKRERERVGERGTGEE